MSETFCLVRRKGLLGEYADNFGIKHQCLDVFGRVEVTLIDSLSVGTCVSKRCRSADGRIFVQNFDSWGDGMGAEHHWVEESTDDIYYVYRPTWANLAVRVIDQPAKSKTA